jgi:ribosomal protein S18 acetylase RimI-like enzyme
MAPTNHQISGTLVINKDVPRVMDLLSSIFDPSHARFTWKDHLPEAYDSVWSWSVDGQPVAGLVTRNIELYGGETGIAIGMVGTDPIRRGRGYASLLTNKVLEISHNAQKSFVILWTRAHLLEFYEAIGFSEKYSETDCKISPQENNVLDAPNFEFSNFDDIPHQQLEKMRHEFNASSVASGDKDTVRRHFKNNHWDGVSGSRGCRFGILYQNPLETSPFYSIIAYDGPDPIIVEFVGSNEYFRHAVIWIGTNLKSVPISYSLSAPHLEKHLESVHVEHQEINYYTMICRLSPDYLNNPITTWLDRI